MLNGLNLISMMIENFKIKVTPEQSRIVQETLFKFGCYGINSSKEVGHTDSIYLYLENNILTHGNNIINFNKEVAPEISFEEFKQKYMQETLTTQVGGNHYQNYAIQPIEFIIKNNIPFLEANIIKYVVRYKNKNGLEDLKKAKHYLEMLIENYDTKE